MAVAIGQVWVGCCPSCHPLGVGKKIPDFFGSPKPSWLLRLRDNSGYSTLHPGKGCLTPPIQFNDQYGYISPFLICGQSWWWIITSSLLMARNWVSNPRLKPSLLGQIFHFWSPLLWFALCRYSLIASTAPCCTAWANGCGWVQIPSASWSLRRWRNSWSCTARSPGLGGFHKIPNSWMVYTSLYMFILENPMKMDDLWVSSCILHFRKPHVGLFEKFIFSGYTHKMAIWCWESDEDLGGLWVDLLICTESEVPSRLPSHWFNWRAAASELSFLFLSVSPILIPRLVFSHPKHG